MRRDRKYLKQRLEALAAFRDRAMRSRDLGAVALAQRLIRQEMSRFGG